MPCTEHWHSMGQSIAVAGKAKQQVSIVKTTQTALILADKIDLLSCVLPIIGALRVTYPFRA